ncbi:MAG: putative glycoside hydrolase [Ruminiclostridium sp.]
MSRKKGFKVKRSRRNLYKRRKSTGRKIFDGVLFVVILGALVFVGYSVASPLIKFFGGNGDTSSVSEPAWTPPESLPETSNDNSQANTSGNTSDSTSGNNTSKDNTSSDTPAEVTSLFATAAPDSALKSEDALNKYLATAKESGYNTVVFTLKNTTGELLYKSSLKAVKDNTDVNKGSLTAAQIVKACKTAEITPVAAITTLYDRKTPYLFDNAGYIITDGDWSWLDSAADNGGKPWTTPYSTDAVNYYADICGELAKAGFTDIELENTIFPNFQSYDYSLLSKDLQNANRSEKLAALADACAKKAKDANATATVEIKADALLTMSATAYDGTAEIWSAKDKMGDSRVLVTMDMSLLGTKLQTSADKTTTVEKDKVKAVNQIFALVKKTVGDKEIAVGITGSSNLSADEIKNCKTALEKLGFTDIRFE